MKPTPDKSLIQIGEEFLIGCGLVAVAVLIVLIAI
jgi:hypothetical protein